MKIFSLLWLFPSNSWGSLRSGNAEFAACKADTVEQAIKIFQTDLPHLHLTDSGYVRAGNCSWCVAEEFNPFL